eukprot:Awhi_evm2s1439
MLCAGSIASKIVVTRVSMGGSALLGAGISSSVYTIRSTNFNLREWDLCFSSGFASDAAAGAVGLALPGAEGVLGIMGCSYSWDNSTTSHSWTSI